MPELYTRPGSPALDYLIECIEEDKEPIASGEDARKSLEVALAVYKSAKTGKAVTLPLSDS
jgi:predicted dehydrogenase